MNFHVLTHVPFSEMLYLLYGLLVLQDGLEIGSNKINEKAEGNSTVFAKLATVQAQFPIIWHTKTNK